MYELQKEKKPLRRLYAKWFHFKYMFKIRRLIIQNFPPEYVTFRYYKMYLLIHRVCNRARNIRPALCNRRTSD